MALRKENAKDHLKILTDIALCIHTIRNYTIYPTPYKHHLHKDLIDQLLRARDSKQLQTSVSKVKSHTDIEYNEAADKTARPVVDGEIPQYITFDEPDPPNGSLRT